MKITIQMTTMALLTGAIAIVPLQTVADVCGSSPKLASEQAVKMLPKGTLIMEFCLPCGDKVAKAITVRTAISERISEEDIDPEEPELAYTTKVNGNEVDLAYVFVLGGDNKKEWVNLGLRVNCHSDRSVFQKVLPAKFLPPH